MKRKIVIILSIFAIMAFGWNIPLADSGKIVSVDVPLPTDINILAPEGGLPKEIAAFSGIWEGKCASTMGIYDAALIVEKITLKEAHVIYSHGKIEAGIYSAPPRFARYNAKVLSDKNQLVFLEQHWTYTFTMNNNLRQLKGTMEWSNVSNKFELTKKK